LPGGVFLRTGKKVIRHNLDDEDAGAEAERLTQGYP
jgi:hypothetical protein